ncbi:MAG: hypothetical protein ACMUJM_18580 [bacterium]
MSRIQESLFTQHTHSPFDHNLFLHRAIGNQGIQRLAESDFFQSKLRISQPNDKYEQEADRVAEQGMQMPEPKQITTTGSKCNNSLYKKVQQPQSEVYIKGKTNIQKFSDFPRLQLYPEEENAQILKGKLVVKCSDVNTFWDETRRKIEEWLSAKGQSVFSDLYSAADEIYNDIFEQQDKVKWNYQYEYEITANLFDNYCTVDVKINEISPKRGEPGHRPLPLPVRTTEREEALERQPPPTRTEKADVSLTAEEILNKIEESGVILKKLDNWLEVAENVSSGETLKNVKGLRSALNKISDPLSKALDAEKKLRASAKLIFAIQEGMKIDPGDEGGVEAAAKIFSALGELGQQIPILGGAVGGYLKFLELPETILQFGKRVRQLRTPEYRLREQKRRLRMIQKGRRR